MKEKLSKSIELVVVDIRQGTVFRSRRNDRCSSERTSRLRNITQGLEKGPIFGTTSVMDERRGLGVMGLMTFEVGGGEVKIDHGY